MASESGIKDIFHGFFKTFFRVLAAGLGVVVIIFLLAILFSSPPGPPKICTLKVLPNDQWRVKPFSEDMPTILNVRITGVIGVDGLTKEDISSQLIESTNGDLKPKQVKAILLTVDSPGGTADDADAIYRMLEEYKKRFDVPVYAFIDGLCASGGTYVACAASKIYATHDSLIGHVGVIMPTFFNVADLMNKIGVQTKTIMAGKEKDLMNPFRPWQDSEGEALQQICDVIYSRFMAIVTTSRPMLTKTVLETEGARLYPAPDAQRVGYIDGQVTSVYDVLTKLAKEAGIEDQYQFVELQTHTNIFSELFGASAELFSKKKKVEYHVRLPGDLHPDLYGKPLCLWRMPENKQ
jgi:signal peptide peptidase SppA